MEDKKIEVVKNWLKPKSIQDIQVFINFANFYGRFIQGFSRIATPLTSMLKITGTSDLAQDNDDNKVIGSGDRNLSKSEKSKNAKSRIQMRIRAIGELTFLISGTKEVFNQLRQMFNKAPIL